ncbi:LOW QUALITY PROTEIN: forkhead box protein J1-like [Strix uralensis]|uniref:LOW QUALITY PROTEIN: forkhead box protein J1-like n=1 Tax=Strix uralensis TaxID=36305 RepID=UPI003DA79A58
MGDSDDLEDSLTVGMWLRDFSNKNTSMGKSSCCPSGPGPLDGHRIPSFAAPCSPLAADPACMGMAHTPCKPPISSFTSRTVHHAMAMHPQLADDIDHETNPHVKPPCSYATLTCMAMEVSDKPQITLSAIDEWITDNFCNFRHADPSWQNSIQNNLSLNKCFIRVPREKGEPGKGGFWKLDPQYADQLKNGASKKRRMTPVQLHSAFTKRAQQEAKCVASPAASASTSKNILNVSVESQQLLEEFEQVTSDLNSNPAGYKRKQPSLKPMARAPSAMMPHVMSLMRCPVATSSAWAASCGEPMIQVLQPGLEERAAPLVHSVINIIVDRCSQEARGLLRSCAMREEDDSSHVTPFGGSSASKWEQLLILSSPQPAAAFCLGCMLQWINVEPECPLCRQPVEEVQFPLLENETTRGHLLEAVLLPWLRRELQAICESRWLQAHRAEARILHTLRVSSPVAEPMVQVLQPDLGACAAPLVHGGISIIVDHCKKSTEQLSRGKRSPERMKKDWTE